MPVKEHGLALLSRCGPSLSLGVGFALDAFFQLNRPDTSGFFRGPHQPEPKQSCTKAGVVDVAACLKSDVEHALIRRSRLRQKLGNLDMELPRRWTPNGRRRSSDAR